MYFFDTNSYDAHLPQGLSTSDWYAYAQDLFPAWLFAMVIFIILPIIAIVLLSLLKRRLKKNYPRISFFISTFESLAIIIGVYAILIKFTAGYPVQTIGFWNYHPVITFTIGIICYFAIRITAYLVVKPVKKSKKSTRRRY